MIKISKSKHIIKCPFHKERMPSCCVDEEKEIFYCFGCDKRGKIEELPPNWRDREVEDDIKGGYEF